MLDSHCYLATARYAPHHSYLAIARHAWHYKSGCFPPPYSLAPASFCSLCPFYPHSPSPFSPHAHGWPLSSSPLSLSLFLWPTILLSSLPMPRINYSILYYPVAGPSREGIPQHWTLWGTPSSQTSIEHIPPSLYLFINTTLVPKPGTYLLFIFL